MNRATTLACTTALTLATLTLATLTACNPTTLNGSSDRAGPTYTIKATASSGGPTNTPGSARPTAKASTKPSNCPDRPDVYLWMRTDGVPDTAQRLGGTTITDCEPSYKMLMGTAPTVPGSCTEIAWVTDNPGYNPDATPAKRLKKVLYSKGPAC